VKFRLDKRKLRVNYSLAKAKK